MATHAQIKANQQNAQKSTGPKSTAGKLKSAANSSKHGLQANPTSIFENHPYERTQYDALKSKLLKQILPEGELELQAFERYAFATYQAERARTFEIEAQSRWLNEPENETRFRQMERIQKLGALQERRADKALTELRKLQRDRYCSMDIHAEMYLLEQQADIPATLPIAEMRKQTQSTSAYEIAAMILTNTPAARAIIAAQTKPIHQTE